MSFRELRTFTETMRLLGYPRLISAESFRNPNIELTSDVFHWLVHRYDPSCDLPLEVSRESDRIFFFKRACEIVLAKGRIRLNVKKLYEADGHAVQELLKLARILRAAMRAVTEGEAADGAAGSAGGAAGGTGQPGDYTALLQQATLKSGANEVKGMRVLSSDLTQLGSDLFFFVERETAQRGKRAQTLNRATEVGLLEHRLRDLVASISAEVTTLARSSENMTADETSLEQKIENKKAQLERSQKRLKSLLAVRPAFMEEYERHESDLHSQFVTYLEQYRNVEFLEHQLARFNRYEDELLEEQETKLKVMREKLRKEELQVLRGDHAAGGGGGRGGGDDGGESDDDDDEDAAASRKKANKLAKKKKGNARARADGSSEESSSSDDDEGGDAARQAAAKAALMNQVRVDHSRGESKRPRAASGRTRPQGADERPAAGTGSSTGAGGRMRGGGGNGLADDEDDEGSLSINEEDQDTDNDSDDDSDEDSDDDSDDDDDDSDDDSDDLGDDNDDDDSDDM